MIPYLLHGTVEFTAALERLRNRGETDFAKVEPAVRAILDDVRREGDDAVLRYVERFEKRRPKALLLRDVASLGKAALERLEAPARAALEHAAERIDAFHRRERAAMFSEMGFRFEDEGKLLGLRVRPLTRVGVYAPGGKARYPSSVLMSAIPARVIGVADIVLATPLARASSSTNATVDDDDDASPTAAMSESREDDGVLAAAYLAGVSAIVDAGGAQAIAALAFGTQSIPRVDKIVGPGNAYVACAKRLVFGAVAIDSIAGPSEILVLADDTADPVHVAADLLSQAEHDEDAYALLITTSRAMCEAVAKELGRQLEDLPRAAIARASLERHGQALIVPDRTVMADVANVIAPEHLSLQVDAPEILLEKISHAGAAFVGRSTPEAAGDYLAGPSHVLPTGGAVRFGSPLGVHDFVARTSIIRYTPEALVRDEADITAFARLEGLEAHARAVLCRTRPLTPSGELREEKKKKE